MCRICRSGQTGSAYSLGQLLDRTADIWIDEAYRGPAGERKYQYLPTFILRGLSQLHIGFTPA